MDNVTCIASREAGRVRVQFLALGGPDDGKVLLAMLLTSDDAERMGELITNVARAEQ